MSSIIYNAVREIFRPTPKLQVEDWLKTHVRFERGPILGAFDTKNSPWIKEPLTQLKNHETREIICACSVQSAKTALAEGAMLYLIAEEGGDMCLYLQTDEHADEFLDTRFKHRILDCKPVTKLLARGDKSIQKRTVAFAHMTQYVMGANNIHNLQSKAAKYVIGDEAAYWPHGHIDESRKRTTSFDARNSKRIYVSTPMNNSGEFYESFIAGSCSEWQVRCPECNEHWPMVLSQLRWDGDGAKLADGKYDLARIRDTVRYECPACHVMLKDDPRVRRSIANSGFYLNQNSAPDPRVKSYHWNALTVPWVSWDTIASEFLKAEYARKLGDYSPLAEFVRKRLGEFWDMREFQSEEVNLSGSFAMEEPWDQEFRRYMTVDVQRDYFRVVVRLWAQNGDSRLFYAGELHTWQQISDLQKRLEINGRRVFVDCGFERYQGEVYRQCAANDWIALKGDRAQFFTWTLMDKRTGRGKQVRRPYSQIQHVDSGVGLARAAVRNARKADLCDRIMWSSDYIKLILHRLRAGQGASWQIAHNAPKWYFKEIQNEVFVTEKDKKTGKNKTYFKKLGENHSFDAEAMQVLAACIEKIIGQAEVSEVSLPKTPQAIEQHVVNA